MIRDGWKSVGKVFVLAIVLDVIYQVVVLRFVYPGEAIVVAFLLGTLTVVFHVSYSALYPALVPRGARPPTGESIDRPQQLVQAGLRAGLLVDIGSVSP